MAWDLWGSSYDQVACYDNYPEHEWQCGFYFGIDRDVIEEDALNEGYCVQVLRILITNADTEIEELEKDLLSLQNELACAEHTKWPEICCSALTERINRLDVAISTLKKDHGDEAETRLLLHNKPAETIHEIVKALQKDHPKDKNGQLVDVSILNPIANATEHALDKESSNIDSSIVLKKEGKELSGITANSISSELLPELQEKRLGDDVKLVLVQEKILSGAEKLALVQEKRPDDAEKPAFIKEKRPDDAEMVEELLAMAIVRSPDCGDISYSPGHSDGLKLSSVDGASGNEEVGRSQLIATDTGQILDLLSSKENGNIPRETKRENAIVKEKHVCSDALRLVTGIKGRKKCIISSFGASHQQKGRNSDLEKKLCELAPKIAKRACKKELNVAPDEDLDSMNCPLQVVYPQDWCPADDAELCSFKGGNGKNSRLLLNIQNTSLTHAENSAMISLFDMQAESTVYPGSQLTDEEKPLAELENPANLVKSDMSFPSKVKTQGKRKFESEIFSSRELHDTRTGITRNTLSIVSTKRQRKPQDILTEVTTNKSLIVSTKRQRKQHDIPTEVAAKTPMIVPTKQQCKSEVIIDDASSNDSMNSKMTKSVVQHGLSDTEDRAIVPYDSRFSEFQKKRKVSKFPITLEVNSNADLDILNSDEVSTENRSQEDPQLTELHSLVGSQNETTDSLLETLKKFTLTNLKVFAKELEVKKYYKLKKGDLIELLVERLSNC